MKKLSNDLEFKSQLQDFMFQLLPSFFDSCNITITSKQTARLMKILLTPQNIIFTYKLLIPIALLYKHFGIMMPEIKSYVMGNIASHSVRLGIQGLASKAAEFSLDENKKIAIEEITPVVDILQEIDIDGLLYELIQEYEHKSEEEISTSEQYQYAIAIYNDAPRLLFKEPLILEKYPQDIISLADVYEIMELNKGRLERTRKMRAIFE